MAVKESSRKRKSIEAPVRESTVTTKKVKTASPKTNGGSQDLKVHSKSKKQKSSHDSLDAAQKTSVAVKDPVDPVEADFAGFGSDTSEEEEDQAAALLAGFGSDNDDDDDVVVQESKTKQPTSSKPIPSIPQSAELTEKLAAGASSSDTPGVIYVGRLPHGFYEHQMTGYFSQFGDINRLRMAHNRRTGSSKHYAFIEFASDEVAKIAADTMDNYLMFSHILKVKYVPQEKVHPRLWEGAGKRFRKIPWNRIEKNRLEKADRQSWEKRSARETKKRGKKMQALKELGYEFEAPALRPVSDVPVSNGHAQDDAVVNDEPVEAPKQLAATAADEVTLQSVLDANGADNVIAKEVKKRKNAGSKRKSSEKISVKSSRKAVK